MGVSPCGLVARHSRTDVKVPRPNTLPAEGFFSASRKITKHQQALHLPEGLQDHVQSSQAKLQDTTRHGQGQTQRLAWVPWRRLSWRRGLPASVKWLQAGHRQVRVRAWGQCLGVVLFLRAPFFVGGLKVKGKPRGNPWPHFGGSLNDTATWPWETDSACVCEAEKAG